MGGPLLCLPVYLLHLHPAHRLWPLVGNGGSSLVPGLPCEGAQRGSRNSEFVPRAQGQGSSSREEGVSAAPLEPEGASPGAPARAVHVQPCLPPGLSPHGHHPDPKSCLATTGVSIPAKAGLPPCFVIAASSGPVSPPGARLPEASGLGRSQRLQSPATRHRLPPEPSAQWNAALCFMALLLFLGPLHW